MSLSQDEQPNQWGVFQDSEAQSLLEGVLQALPEEASILLAGHEAAQPLAERFISAGHQVHSVDSAVSVRDYTPETSFDAIAVIFSLYHLSRAETYTQIVKFSEWLQPGGQLVLATSVVDSQNQDHNRSRHECVDECVRCYPVACMGDRFQATVFSKKGWASMAEKAGFSIETPGVDITLQLGSPERHHVLAMRKTEQQALMGPYPIPGSYRGPHLLSEEAWGPFASRLVRDEFDAVLDVLKGNQKVLDVGSGYGSKSYDRIHCDKRILNSRTELPKEVAARTGKAYSIEPNPDRNSIQAANAKTDGIEIAQGTAENIPFADSTFDAVVAMWVLHYVVDLEKSLQEMARVADRSAPNARLVIVQGAPDNEVIDLMNSVCAPISAESKRPNHQGFLLRAAAEVFAQCGFGDVSLHRVEAFCEFRDEDLEERCQQAAGVVAGLWCLEDANFQQMKEALVPRLRFNFQDRPYAIGDQGVVLVAQPLPN